VPALMSVAAAVLALMSGPFDGALASAGATPWFVYAGGTVEHQRLHSATALTARGGRGAECRPSARDRATESETPPP
jgi:hypothetical protein